MLISTLFGYFLSCNTKSLYKWLKKKFVQMFNMTCISKCNNILLLLRSISKNIKKTNIRAFTTTFVKNIYFMS